ncbi:hypothetical protein L226DRAFT_474088, partial [Lentinus tigrinus ALCF2SS1-7]
MLPPGATIVEALFKQSSDGNPAAIMCTFLVVALNLFYHLTLPGCRFALKVLRALVRTQPLPSSIEESEGIPADLATALKHFNIEPDAITYACCPECFALYPP